MNQPTIQGHVMRSAPNLTIEKSLPAPVAGVDEAGRGPWAGPVVAAAVIIKKKLPRGVHDCKLVPREKREELFGIICARSIFGIGIASVEEIDHLNILQATLLAMGRAVEALGMVPAYALVDGNRAPQLTCPVRTVVGGDGTCLSIAAASIIAKVTRDRMMAELATLHPGYGFEQHAGYGTKAHQDAIARLGICPAHRRSYAPIRACLERGTTEAA